MERQVYKKPPIVEAVYEFRFPDSDWDIITWLPILHSSLQNRYPQKPIQLQEQSFEAKQNESKPGLGINIRHLPKFQFRDNDHKQLVTISPTTLAINDLEPYSGWDNLQPRIMEALTAYGKAVGNRPLSRIGARYINRIELVNDGSLDLEEYFTIMPSRPDELPPSASALFMKIDFVYPDEQVLARVTFNTEMPFQEEAKETAKVNIILDIDVFANVSGIKLNDSAIIQLVESLRNKERTIFEAVITSKTRELFHEPK